MMKTVNINQIVSNTSYVALVKEYKNWLQTLGYCNSIIYNYPRYVAYFLQHLTEQNIHQINLLKQKNVQHYFTHLEQRPHKRIKHQTLSSASLNNNFIAIDKFLEFLHQMDVSNTPPPTKYQIEHQRKKPLQILTKQEVKALYEAVPLTFSRFIFATREPRQMTVKLVLDLCYGCGLRRTEALNLKIRDVNFDTKIIHIRQGKNYKDRYVPMSKKVYQSLQTYIYQYRKSITKRPEYIYPFGNAALAEALQFLSAQTSNTTLQNKNPTLHTLRHSIATHLLQNGMSIENISTFLGHSSLTSTQLYTHLTMSGDD